MTTLEESVAETYCTQDLEVVPYIPYIFQDFWELGTPPEIVIKHIENNFKNSSDLKILDLGCGKGVVSIKIADTLKCNCYGIDGIETFIEEAKEKAAEYGVDKECRFEFGDVREKIKELGKFDVIILGATGPIFKDYTTALKTLREHLTDEGIIIIEECYISDSSDFEHPKYLPQKELLKQFKEANMELIDETVCRCEEFLECVKEKDSITIRCQELIKKCPEKATHIENYMKNQVWQCDLFEDLTTDSVMVLKKK